MLMVVAWNIYCKLF